MSKEKGVGKIEEFKNLYELSRTLQFRLVPLKVDDRTNELVEDEEWSALKSHGIIEADKKMAENIKVVKFYLDILHRKIIDNSLRSLNFEKKDLLNYAAALDALAQGKKDKDSDKNEKKMKIKELKTRLLLAQGALLEQIDRVFKKAGADDLSPKKCLLKLKESFTSAEVKDLREKNNHKELEFPDIEYQDKQGSPKNIFEMDAGYLADFCKKRELLYSVKGKKGSLSERILSNFELFYKNIKNYQDNYKNTDIDFSLITERLCRNNEDEKPGIFDVDYYNNCITQQGIDNYARILGGESHKKERMVSGIGLNQVVNLYIQKKQSEHKELQKQKKKGQERSKFNKREYPFFVRLQKRILSQIFRKEIFIENDSDLIRELNFFLVHSEEKVAKAQGLLSFFLDHDKNGINLSKVFLAKNKVNTFANKIFREPEKFMAIFHDGRTVLDLVTFDDIKNFFKNNRLEYKNSFDNIAENRDQFEVFISLLKHEVDLLILGGETIVMGGKKEAVIPLEQKKIVLEKAIRWFEDKVKNDEKMRDEDEGDFCLAVLSYSRAVLDIVKRAEIFWLNEEQETKIDEGEKDRGFYEKFDGFIGDDFVPFIYFDKFGNYLKKRSRNTTKEIKLNFGADHLLDGWDMNKELDYHGVLLRKNNEYYLGVGNKRGDLFHKKFGKKIEEVKEAYNIADDEDYYEKIEYKQLDIGKFEGIAFGKANDKKKPEELKNKKLKLAEEFLDGDLEKLEKYINIKKEYDEFKELRKKEKRLDFNFPKEKMDQLIEYYISCLGKRDDWRRFNLNFRRPQDYKDRDDFVAHVQRQAYWIDLKRVNKNYVQKNIKDGSLFLFRIHTKDFYDIENKLGKNNPYKQANLPSKVNLFTQYFFELFSLENIANIKSKDTSKCIYELDGKAEIRFRPKTEDVRLKTYQKNGKDIVFIDQRDGNKEKEVIQHRRFAKDALILHLKIRLNFGKQMDLDEFNKEINKKLIAQVPVRILGMDRGENNLIYYCILNEYGEIEDRKCGSLNKVGEKVRKLADGTEVKEPVDYFQLLVSREGQRDWEQKNWQKMTPIRSLKEAYLGNVIHWISREIFSGFDRGIATLNVLEDLGGNFKKTRFFRERQVYQAFEKSLIDKLGYLVDKERANFRGAYQLTPLIDSVEQMEKNNQIGAVIYIPASYTSKICPHPKCGWRKRLHIKNSESKEKIIKLLKSGDIKISYDSVKDRFSFEYAWKQECKNKGKNDFYEGVDVVFSNVSRTKWNDVESRTIEFNDGVSNSITTNLKSLFQKNGVELKDISKQLVERGRILETEFFQAIIFYFNLITQIRNYNKEKTGSDADYIECPSCSFDSRKSEMNGNLSVITNGDANGAYNIARKGLMQLYKIRKNYDDPGFISNKDWDSAVRDWKKFVSINT